MQLNILTIYTNGSTSGIPSSELRKTVIAITDSMDEKDKAMINLHYTDDEMKDNKTRKIPYVLFGKPHKNSFKLFSYGDDGYILFEKIKKLFKKSFSVHGKHFEIKNVSLKVQNTTPKLSQRPVTYRTVTPLICLNGGERQWVDWLFHNVKDDQEKDSLLKEKVLEVLRKNIKYQMRQLFNSEKEFKNFDNIDITWKIFKTITIKSRDKKEIGVVGEFESNYELPRFVGRRIGYGFGEIARSA